MFGNAAAAAAASAAIVRVILSVCAQLQVSTFRQSAYRHRCAASQFSRKRLSGCLTFIIEIIESILRRGRVGRLLVVERATLSPDMEDFQETLLGVAQALSSTDTKAIAFLCMDYLPQVDLSSVESATDVFLGLMDNGLLSKDQPYLLADLLFAIGNIRVLREFDLSRMMSTTRSIICPYRKLLYTLSENITTSHLKSIKFLLLNHLQRPALEAHVSTLEVFLALERKGHLSILNLKLLEKTLLEVCPVLQKNIQQFKDSHGQQTTHLKGPITQETGVVNLRLRSSSDSSTSPAKIPMPDRPHSEHIERGPCEKVYLQVSSLHISNTTSESSTDPPLAATEPQTSSGPPQPPATESQHEDVGVLASYTMTGHRRGVCWIVNNYDFSLSKGKHRNRQGTQLDEKRLRCVFTWLGFQVEVVPDATGQQMLSSMRALAQRDHSGRDCVACVVLSHGAPGCVYGVDGAPVTLTALTEPLGGSRCVSLRGKPKLLFIQACQGNATHRAFCVQADGPGPSSSSSSAPGAICSDAAPLGYESVPCRADFLTAMSTVPAFASLRDPKEGTWFIRSLCQNLVQMVPRGQDLVSILTQVNADVSQMIDPDSSRRQMPQPAFSLRKRVVFPVPTEPPPALPTTL